MEIRNNNSALEKNYEIVQSSPEYEDELLAKIEEKDMMETFSTKRSNTYPSKNGKSAYIS
mgnify:CR=1 FL=1